MASPDIRIENVHVSPPDGPPSQDHGSPLVHSESAPVLVQDTTLLSPTLTRGSLQFKNRRPPPKPLDNTSSTSSIAFHGLNKRDHAIPTPYPAASPRFGRFLSRDVTPADSRSGTPPFDEHHRPMHVRRSSRSSFVQAIDDALDSVVETLSMRERIKHFTWTWFTMNMATGQLANVIYQCPFKFRGQFELGCTVFLFNIALFFFNVAMITARFRMYPHTFRASFLHPTESLFIPAAVVSVGTVFSNITAYVTDAGRTGVWLSQTMTILFWVYGGFAICFTCGIYLVMWSTQSFTISQMTPVWIFPAYPLLVIGPHAGILSSRATASNSLEIIVGGFAFQGIGFMVATMVYAAFLYRLMTNKLPKESLRPGMFISVGPSGFTIAGVVNMGQNLMRVIPERFMGVEGRLAATISMVVANWLGIWLWGLAIFFFIVSVGANMTSVAKGKMVFAMNWYSFIFPNTGLIAATFAISKALNINRPIAIIGCVLTVLIGLLWVFVFAMMVRAVVLKQILWPQKQEDRDEGGFVMRVVENEHRMKHRDGDSEKDSAKSAVGSGPEILVGDVEKGRRTETGLGLGIGTGSEVPGRPGMPKADSGGGSVQARTEKW